MVDKITNAITPLEEISKINEIIDNIGDTDFASITGQPTDNTNLATALNSKVNTSSLSQVYPVIDTYVNGTSGYRIWSDGYCEQWGYVALGTSAVKTITLLKKYINKDSYIVTGALVSSNTGNVTANGISIVRSTTDMTASSFTVQAASTVGKFWKTSGYLASGQYTPKTIKGVQE